MTDRVEITRVVTGAITDGQTVLIDYTYQPLTESEATVYTTSYGISHQFKNGFSLYYDYHDSDYHVRPSTSIDYSATDHIFGAAFRRWRMYSKYEYRVHESEYPYHSQTANIGTDITYLNRKSTSASATWTRINHEGPTSSDVELFDLQLNNRWNLTENAGFTGTMRYRDQTDTLNGDETGTSYTLRFFLRRHKTRFSILASTKTYDTLATREYKEVRLEVIRRF